eukprot:CAMPEP_0206487614 /NCGR_PEP_ID=MMETSP0324_2-20121206/41766_1 /ASSEMBLY_ACC=CAM_ASM_000836 /TAXON_ID=2866 /ORGANISM="Crypthecodinium cohnii, Strain Seligo" /LENGTH=35 /DNA_ID= /DNA_START= /DNA_END= /DNA_ORIENTATION=
MEMTQQLRKPPSAARSAQPALSSPALPQSGVPVVV